MYIPLSDCVSHALFDYSESETSLLDLTVLLQISPAVNPNPPVRTDSCVIKQTHSHSDTHEV